MRWGHLRRTDAPFQVAVAGRLLGEVLERGTTMQILIWRNNRWEPFPEEELRQLRRLAREQEVDSATSAKKYDQRRTRPPTSQAPDVYAEA